MRRVQNIIYQETISPSVITLVVLTFVVFTREFGRLAELFIRKNAAAVTIGKAILFLLPSILIFTVPFAFLIGTLIGFSRLSSDSEIVAMRAGGVSIFQMVWPVLKIGLVVVLVTASFTLFFLPSGNWELRQLRHEIRAAPVHSEIKPRVFFEEFPGLLIYCEDIDLKDSAWKGIFLADTTRGEETRIILAQSGSAVPGPDGKRLQLHFETGTIYSFRTVSPEQTSVSRFGTLDIPIELNVEEVSQNREKRNRDKNLEDLLRDIRLGSHNNYLSSLVELHRRLALPLSGILFAILAVTLGSRSPRAGRGYGFVISITVAFTYYILFATGSTLSETGVLPIPIGVWGANILFGLLALLTLIRGNRELERFQFIGRMDLIAKISSVIGMVQARISYLISAALEKCRQLTTILPRIRLRLARVVDLYMMRSFLLYFLVTLAVCLSLVTLFTFFDLIDDIFRNSITYTTVLEYFIFIQPHFLVLLIPISILVATLVTFGSLEKTNQIVALKSCGISVYRIAIPVFVLGVGMSCLLFVLQEEILPLANQRQDNLRNTIKGSPAQTTQPGRNWIFGGEDRLFNYNLFNTEQDAFAELSFFRLDMTGSRLKQMVYAHGGVWDRQQQQWRLQDGWTRDFVEGEFQTFEDEYFPFPERPDYFDEQVLESSKMNYFELRSYIDDLQQGGFEVDYLRTQLYKKLSFPLVNLIMTLIGLPFALTMGRKGALYGVAAGVLIGIVYWGAFGVFDVLGSNGLIAPLLAAWGPNIVFGAGAGILLSGIRT